MAMMTTQDDSRYDWKDSWWRPCFLNPETDAEFSLEYNRSALLSARIGFGILIAFWCGFGGLDLFLPTSSKTAVLVFRFAVVAPAAGQDNLTVIRFTAIPAEIDAYFQSHRQHSTPAQPKTIAGA